jgi:hypothetical protein
MKYGSVRRSVSIFGESLDASYCPDGLNEADIDALLTESGLDVDLDEFEHEVAPVIQLPAGEPTSAADQAGGEAA